MALQLSTRQYKLLTMRRGTGSGKKDHADGVLTAEELEFLQLVETFKRINNVKFPTTTHYLRLLKWSGYRKTAHRGNVNLDTGRLRRKEKK